MDKNLLMSLVDLFQFALAIGIFIWFMNWMPPRLRSFRELRQRRLEDDPEPVKPPGPEPDATPESN
jgi:hypothetical protein